MQAVATLDRDTPDATRAARWRQRQVDQLRCGHCAQPMPVDDLRTVCPLCRRAHTAMTAYVRAFLRDFR